MFAIAGGIILAVIGLSLINFLMPLISAVWPYVLIAAFVIPILLIALVAIFS